MHLPPEIVRIILHYKEVFEQRERYTTRVMAEYKMFYDPEVMECINFLSSTRFIVWDVDNQD